MKIFKKVRSTAIDVPSIEVNIDTVYIRTDIKKIEEIDFSGWEYNEIQYEIKEYISKLASEEDSSMLALMVSMLMSEVDMLKSKIKELEVK
jgi:hypothetical protein